MTGSERKKTVNIQILNILKEYSDDEHRLTQQEILRLLEEEYGTNCDRRTVKTNVEDLVAAGYGIVYENGYYLRTREFEDAELRMLMDSVLFSKGISQNQAKKLLAKLKKLGNRYFEPNISHVSGLSEKQYSLNKQVIYNLDALDRAIGKKKKIQFIYNHFDTDLNLRPRRDEPFIMNPYHIVASNGRYYLIGNIDKFDNVAHYRVDRMKDVEVLDEQVKPMKEVKGLENGLDLPKHMAEHIYMFSGESVPVRFRVSRVKLDDVVDWFGRDIIIVSKTEDDLVIRVMCNKKAFYYWALQYGDFVEVLKPESLREELLRASEGLYEKYHREGS